MTINPEAKPEDVLGGRYNQEASSSKSKGKMKINFTEIDDNNETETDFEDIDTSDDE